MHNQSKPQKLEDLESLISNNHCVQKLFSVSRYFTRRIRFVNPVIGESKGSFKKWLDKYSRKPNRWLKSENDKNDGVFGDEAKSFASGYYNSP